METTQFTENAAIINLIQELKNESVNEKQFSDVIDGEGNQYVELVQEGGSVLGIALVGYTYVLEKMGIRFFSLAGTSAGSINALALAALGNISSPKVERLIDILANKDLYEFIDGDSDAKSFIHAIVSKASRLKLVLKGMQVIDNLYDDLGLNPGDNFLEWISEILEENGVNTTEKLLNSFEELPSTLQIRNNVHSNLIGLKPRFGVIASDITTETKVEFPRMRSLYWAETDKVNPAYYVRASMAIPYFFTPFIVRNIPHNDIAKENWDKLVSYKGQIPKEVHLVDGGTMSNFPIDIFHKKNTVPRLPTFGIKLGEDRNKAHKISNPIHLFAALFNSLRHLHDYDFILKNSDYNKLIKTVDVGEHNWLNFALTDQDKIDLFQRGAYAAAEFLREFDWPGYKKIREKMVVDE